MKVIIKIITLCIFLFFATDGMAQSACKSNNKPNIAKQDCRQQSCRACLTGYIWVNPTKRANGTLVCGYCRKMPVRKKSAVKRKTTTKYKSKKKY